LCTNISGGTNTAVGIYTLRANTGGSNNTAVGGSALTSNTTGTSNLALGNSALLLNTTGNSNIALGPSLGANISGNNNIAIGVSALASNTTGNFNIAIGCDALGSQNFGSTSSSANVAVGYRALRANSTGTQNTALGTKALTANTTGASNTALGNRALEVNTIGGNNIAVGFSSLIANISGTSNTAIGINALCKSTNNNNTAIGSNANNGIISNLYTIAVGSNSATSADDYHTVWGATVNNICNCVYVDWSNVSDSRDKAEIETLSSDLGLNLIRKLRPVKYKNDHRDTYVRKCGFEYGQKDGTLAGDKEHYGLIAQELHQALNELGARFDALGHDGKKDAYRLTYAELSAPIIKSIQELDERLKIVEARLDIQN